jgi:precorrin-3B synthase
MNGPRPRGACPGLSTPMLTGDGLLVRLAPTAPMPLAMFVALCRAAAAHGNGTMEVTARGSLQVRGLDEQSAGAFASDVAALGIPAEDGVTVAASPLHDKSACADADAIADGVRAAIRAAALALAPKVSVVVDGGGRLHLDDLKADIRLRAMEGCTHLHVALAGDARTATPLGEIAIADAAHCVVALLKVIAAHGPSARAGDVLREKGITAFHATMSVPLLKPGALRARVIAEPLGTHHLKGGGTALGLCLAFGHALASDLIALAALATQHGAVWLRPAPGRALLVGPLSPEAARAVARDALGLGFIADISDPRRRIVACAGAPCCASGHLAARSIAQELAQHLPAGNGVSVHVSGCAKGCACQKSAPLTIVGTAQGCFIVRNGTARSRPVVVVAEADLVSLLRTEDADALEAAHV